jgi:septum formation protein
MNNESLPAPLILASGSKYRKMLLQRLGKSFQCHPPDIDESAYPGESPRDTVIRLAREKASVIASLNPAAIVIGSDQLAVFENQVIGKPGNHEYAVAQLKRFSGQVIEFLTAVAVNCADKGISEQHLDITRVYFRSLNADEIERYLQQEKPYDCAGAFKAESLGIVLFEKIVSEDPTALIGLPLIRTSAMLRRAGIELP